MAYKMTDGFAEAMVTVIPVILLVGTVEFTAMAKRLKQGEVLTSLWQALLLPWWLLVATTHFVAEGALVLWLATTERSSNPWLAEFLAWTLLTGFATIMVSTLGALSLVLTSPLAVTLRRAFNGELDLEVPSSGPTSEAAPPHEGGGPTQSGVSPS